MSPSPLWSSWPLVAWCLRWEILHAWYGVNVRIPGLIIGFYQDFAAPTKGEKSAEIVPSAFESGDFKVYPNPFGDRVTFEFVSAKDARARLEINNVLGQRITVLMDENVAEGVMNRIEYKPADVVSGILIYRLILDDEVNTGRLIYRK